MNFLEKDLEEIIYKSDKSKLSEKGLFVRKNEIFKRQFKIGNYGIADLVSFTRPYYNPIEGYCHKGSIIVYELKKEKVSISTFLQAATYLKGIKRYLSKRNLEYNYDYSIRLIGKEFDKYSSFCYLPELINGSSYDESINRPSLFNLEIFTYNYGIDGIEFNEVYGYSLINEGF